MSKFKDTDYTGLYLKFFVLKPRGNDMYAKASRKALEAYAKTIEEYNVGLAADIYNWVYNERQHKKGKK